MQRTANPSTPVRFRPQPQIKKKMRKINLQEEKNFENRLAMGEDLRANQKKFYWATELETELHNLMTTKKITNKDILEIGCSGGEEAKNYVNYSKSYIGIDISDETIRNAEKLGLKNAKFLCTDGHSIPLPDNSVDCVVVNSLLHHLDLYKSFPEMNRVLKKNGSLIFREPLGTNPLLKLYRYLTPRARTNDERPFSLKDLSLMSKYFHVEEIQWFGFLSLISVYIKSRKLRRFLSHLDKTLSKTYLRYFFWQFSGIARKKDL